MKRQLAFVFIILLSACSSPVSCGCSPFEFFGSWTGTTQQGDIESLFTMNFSQIEHALSAYGVIQAEGMPQVDVRIVQQPYAGSSTFDFDTVLSFAQDEMPDVSTTFTGNFYGFDSLRGTINGSAFTLFRDSTDRDR